ncbi:peptidoglycan-binding domain-containing protein [Archangium lansingense]|uniref:Peptidoglycan-binding domain-containing protein n=1 Tax=Archangium lansingense TaxID=2995310 RepID=A0ABT3ZZ14_9BACT|nr:peptidoglycan-binding domain-containing protein [Archangium lansinium]MCY1074284.1 peptidoglycan-binding domain-containing protein [Archangium lansinium]
MATNTQREGSRGPAVVQLQNMLNSKGFPVGAADGAFGPKTKGAVIAFQRAMGLAADGVVGPKTWAALGVAGATLGATQTNGGTHLTARLNNQPNGPGLATGSITVDGRTYQFNSGSRKLLSVPQGTYRVRAHRNSRSEPGFVRDGVGFSFLIEDAHRPNSDAMSDRRDKADGMRTLLRIHPDGGSIGTAGCIGIVGNGATLRQFRDGMNAELRRHGGTCTLRVQ